MKKIAVLFILSLSLLTSCESDQSDPSPSGITGSWLWIRSDGGIEGNTIYPEAGEKRILVFTTDGNYSLLHNDTLKESATYYLDPNDTIFVGIPASTLVLENRLYYYDSYWGLQERNPIEYFGQDTIALGYNGNDNYVSLYIRN